MKKRLWTAVLCVLALGVLGGAAYYVWLVTPPPMPATLDEAAALITSRRFQRLSDDRKLSYAAHIRKLMEAADRDERRRLRETYGDDPAIRAAMRDLGEQFVVDMARGYAEAPPMQQQIILDTIIGMMERERARREARAAERGPSPPRTEEQLARDEQRRAEAVEDIAERAATGNAQHAAYLGGMFKGLQKRRAQLGLPAWRPPD